MPHWLLLAEAVSLLRGQTLEEVIPDHALLRLGRGALGPIPS
jgi:hypothetical protein